MWNIEGMLMAAFLVVPLAAVFAQPAGLGQSEMKKVSSAQDLLVKSEVETAISMLQTISAKQKKGELTMEQAKQLGADLLRGLRYGQDGYFYANTTDGVNIVMYGRKDFEGKNKLDLRDAKGNFFVREYMAKAKAGGGYVNYWFPKPNQTTPLPKRTYVQFFKPFGWVIGTGYYLPSSKTPKEKSH